MLYVIHAIDGPGGQAKRKAVYDAHRAHLDAAQAQGVTLVTAGPLVGDDGETSLGSLFIVEAPNRAAAEGFNRNDPFSKNGVWEKVAIHGFLKRR